MDGSTSGHPTADGNDATSGADASTSDGDSNTSESGDSGTTTETAPESCPGSESDYGYVRVSQQQGPFEIDMVCTVEQIGGSADFEFMDVACAAETVRLTSDRLDFGEYFGVADSVEVFAVGDPSSWQHVALFDEGGAMVMGSYDLSPQADDYRDVFLSVDYEVFGINCEPFDSVDGCTFQRMGLELTLDGQTQSTVDGIAVDFGAIRILTAALLYEGRGCEDFGGVSGYFTMLASR